MVKGKKTYAPSSIASTASDGEQWIAAGAPQARAPAPKHRASRSGTRCVSTMSSDQLTRKRANDREAQRAIRQRAKEHIEHLERRIQELTQAGGGDAAALLAAQRRNRELELELTELRLNSIKVESGSPSDGEWQSDIESCTSSVFNPTDAYTSTPSSEGRENFQSSNTYVPRLPRPGVAEEATTQQTFKLEQYSGAIQGEGTYSVALEMERSWNEAEPPSSASFNLTETFAPSFLPLGNEALPFLWEPSLHSWELPIKFLPPTGIVDNLLIAVLQEQRSQYLVDAAQGTRLVGPANMRNLLYYDQSSIRGSDPVSDAIAEILHSTCMPNLPEKTACLFIMHKLLCWQISPVLETYENIPEWFSPRPSQLVEAHPLWISLIPWPRLRDKVIRNQLQYATNEFQDHFSASISINWPYRDVDILMFEDGEIRITPMFESHVSKLENWSVNAPFSTRYPELREFCRFTDAGFPI